MNSEKGLQQLFFEEILQQFPKKAAAVADLMEVLALNKDSVYRRLRGSTDLTAAELQLLAARYNISIDKLLDRESQGIVFNYNFYNQQITSFLHYLEQVKRQITHFNQHPGFHVYYASREIPVFIYMMFPRLLTFKLYVYGLTTWQFDYLDDRPFSFDLVSAHELQIAEETAREYCLVNSTDFWTLSILEQSLNQLEYMAMAGRITDRETASAICEEIRELVNHSRAMAEAGKKYLPGKAPTETSARFELFHNELAVTNNTILALSDNYEGLFHTLDTPNFLFTFDERICLSMRSWVERITNHATAISVHSSKSRDFFFNRLFDKIERSQKQIELTFEKF